MDQQVAVVLGADPAAFEVLISQLMSSANELRSQAEALFNLCRDRRPDALALKLAQLLHSSQSLEIRDMAAVLLHKQVTSSSSGPDSDESSSYIWARLTPATQSSIKSLLLSAVQLEETRSIAKKLYDTVSELALDLVHDGAWPEFFPFLLQAVKSDSPRVKESGLRIALILVNRRSLF